MHKYGYSVPLREIIIKPLIASIVMGAVIHVLNLDLFVSIIIGVIVYFAMIFLLRTFNDEDISIIKQLLPAKVNEKLDKLGR